MITPLARTVRKLKQAISRRLPQRRDDSGLTTLEWLLIVAAVAGLAALAVVLVSNVVSETGEQIAGSSARLTAAKVQALDVTTRAHAETAAEQTNPVLTLAEHTAVLNADYKQLCKRIGITFGDVKDLKVFWVSTGYPANPTTETDGNVITGAVWNNATPVFGCVVFVS